MQKRIRRTTAGLGAAVLFGVGVLVTDIPKTLEQMDKSFAFIAKSLGVNSPPDHFVSDAWGHLWVVVLAFVVVFVVGVLLLWGVEVAWTRRWGNDRAAPTAPDIDKSVLADECERIAQGILSLVAEHTASIQDAWHQDLDASFAARARGEHHGPLRAGSQHASAVGKLIEKFGDRHSQEAWSAIHRAARVMVIRESDIWPLKHGMFDQHMMPKMAILLTKVSAGLRDGQKELSNATDDRDRPI